MEDVFVCIRECAGDNAIVMAVLIVGHLIFSMWASTLKKDKWWEKVAHIIAINWGYLIQKNQKPTPPEEPENPLPTSSVQ